MHVVFRTVPAFLLSQPPGCQPGGLFPALPVGIHTGGKETPGGILGYCGGRKRVLYLQFQGYVYDFAYYTDAYPDIRKAFGEDDAAALKHFVTFGMTEGRRGNAKFDVNFYRMQYGDLRSAFGDDLSAYYKHYIDYGIAEGRQAKESSSDGDAQRELT